MIHAFSFKNFYSFKDETVVDFRVNKNAPDTKLYFVDDSKTRLSKIEMIIGANASGKTNAIKPLAFLQWFITHSFRSMEVDEKLPIQPFVFDGNKNKPTEIKVIFEMNKDIYEYFVALTPERVQQEFLKCKSVVNKNTSTKTLFMRKWDKKTKKYIFDNKKDFGLPDDFILRENASVISTGRQYQHKQSIEIIKFWHTLETNVVEVGWSGGMFSRNSRMHEVFEALSLYHKDDVLKKKMERMIRKYDIGLSGFKIDTKKDDKGNIEFNGIKGIHQVKDINHTLDFEYESSGTKHLFAIIPTIIRILEQGGIAVIDELESNLHSIIVKDIINLFIHPETNRKNAQIIFTMNNHYLLTEPLEKYQVNIVKKDRKGISEFYNLSELGDNIKKGEDLYRRYNAGAYGGLPNIG